MNYRQYLLICLEEECLEVAHITSKAIRFGPTDIQPGQALTNAERIDAELDDLRAVIELLYNDGLEIGVSSRERIDAKAVKLRKYAEYSRQIGILK